MKINETGRIGAVQQIRRHDAKLAGMADRKKMKDEVQISPEAKELLGARGAASAQPVSEARRQLVEQLKHSVSAGTYSVDPRTVAERLLPYIK
ncbi:MAG: flagellar biosynthesis anti-sigma factor FlgM [Paenibacillaceae bacterium]|uniref:flagellar biosynthesis anti-sigma factor FlgM n=1 Tax=Paenibacillus cymbidii TaxID=1639034 RepID=UPI001081DB63|nr:flagellar biosynthesis anti-sigma factor FlgM [Paenibacillus cymbidii]MBO9608526.1 flagellar biosynthesis anti-sigma factor FlgM [Paenibacillaceae bacterium]